MQPYSLFLCTVSTNCWETQKIFAKIRKKKSERLKEKNFQKLQDLKLRWTSPLKVSGYIKPVFMLEMLD